MITKEIMCVARHHINITIIFQYLCHRFIVAQPIKLHATEIFLFFEITQQPRVSSQLIKFCHFSNSVQHRDPNKTA